MELLQQFWLLAIGAATFFYFVVKVSLSHWKKRGILHEKPKFLWGNLKGVGQKRHITTAIIELYEKYKGKAPFIGFFAYLKPMIFILDSNLIQEILTKNSSSFMERGLYQNVSDEPLSCNLMQLDGKKWLTISSQTKLAFTEARLQTILPTLVKVSETFKKSFSEKQKIQKTFIINDLIDGYNMDVISSLAFGLEGGDSLKFAETEFRIMTRNYLKNFNLFKAYLAFCYPNLARLLQYKSYEQTTSEYFLKLVNDKIKEREWNRTQRQIDFLTLFTNLRRSSNRLNNKEIAAQAFSFILAGLQTCNATLTFCFYELALQPELQQKARLEIENVLMKHKDQISIDSLKDMTFLKQIIKETLRKHTPYPFLLRTTAKDFEVPDSVFMLKKGNYVIIPIAAIHKDPQIYPKPDLFDPERFNSKEMEERNPMAWLPFGLGPRSCIAQQFAELQMLVCLVTLLRNHKFSPCSDTCIPLQYDNKKLLLTPKSNLKLIVEQI